MRRRARDENIRTHHNHTCTLAHKLSNHHPHTTQQKEKGPGYSTITKFASAPATLRRIEAALYVMQPDHTRQCSLHLPLSYGPFAVSCITRGSFGELSTPLLHNYGYPSARHIVQSESGGWRGKSSEAHAHDQRPPQDPHGQPRHRTSTACTGGVEYLVGGALEQRRHSPMP